MELPIVYAFEAIWPGVNHRSCGRESEIARTELPMLNRAAANSDL